MSDYHQIAAQALAKCAAYDPWFPQPNRATVDAWAEQIQRYALGITDVLDGVTKMYADNGSGFRPLPKDLIDAARSERRERDAQTGPTPEYQALCESKFISYEESLARLRARTGQRSIGQSVGEAS